MTKQEAVGQQFGFWTVLDISDRKRSLFCRCVCGTEKSVWWHVLSSGQSSSCGCKKQELVKANRQPPSKTRNHGKSRMPEYRIWAGMRQRCGDGPHASKDYGPRGIRVCERWQTFENFYADMGPRPRGMTIDRKDPNGNYEPSNCRWATRQEQATNKRNTHFITWNGKTQSAAQWERELGLGQNVVAQRIKKGCPIEQVLNISARKHKTLAPDLYLRRCCGTAYSEPPSSLHYTLIDKVWAEIVRPVMKKGEKVLDIGAGDGHALTIFEDFGLRPIGLNIHEQDVIACQSKGLNCLKGDMHRLSALPHDFSLVWFRHCLEHSPFPMLALANANLVLKPGGYMYVEVPIAGTPCKHEENPSHWSLFSREVWIQLFLRAGFDVLNQITLEFNTLAGDDIYYAFLCRKPIV